MCGRWWRTLTATTPEEAQPSLDRFLARAGDARPRRTATGARTTVDVLGDAGPLLALPAAPFPRHYHHSSPYAVCMELGELSDGDLLDALHEAQQDVPRHEDPKHRHDAWQHVILLMRELERRYPPAPEPLS